MLYHLSHQGISDVLYITYIYVTAVICYIYDVIYKVQREGNKWGKGIGNEPVYISLNKFLGSSMFDH